MGLKGWIQGVMDLFGSPTMEAPSVRPSTRPSPSPGLVHPSPLVQVRGGERPPWSNGSSPSVGIEVGCSTRSKANGYV